jgi:NAD(P)-dependent dehydrogenase (short-subunit alcohol dehydrogenase family)
MMTDPRGKTVVMTGATSGIGQATAIALARQGARVLVVGRDHTRGEATVKEMARVGETGEFLAANLLSLKDIARLASEVRASMPSLDVLINNAGGVFRTRTMSADGIEATFALNTVAPFTITSHLHGLLARANGRVVNIATGFLGRTKLNVDELVNPPSYSSFGSYSRAKLALIMLTLEQAERWKRDGISAVAVQPGIVMGTRFGGGDPSRPSLGRSVGAPIMKLLGIGATLDQATERYQKAAFDRLASGTYFAWGKVAKFPNQAQDAGVRLAVWRLLEKLTNA